MVIEVAADVKAQDLDLIATLLGSAIEKIARGEIRYEPGLLADLGGCVRNITRGYDFIRVNRYDYIGALIDSGFDETMIARISCLRA